MRWGLLCGVGAVAACIGLVGCGGGGGAATTSAGTTTPVATTPETTNTAQTTIDSGGPLIEVRFVGGVITGGGRQSVPLGSNVRIRVTSDVADEVHLHGYDKKVDVTPDAPSTLAFNANIPGIFEVELESRSLKLIDVEVR